MCVYAIHAKASAKSALPFLLDTKIHVKVKSVRSDLIEYLKLVPLHDMSFDIVYIQYQPLPLEL